MVKFAGILLLLLACAVSASPVQQEEPPPPTDSPYEFVSGVVSELPPGKIVVNRAVLGKPAENRTFLIGPDTKIEGRLRVKVRVTVGFRTGEDAEPTAVRIIVRQQAGKK
ncbi:MAG: hypothetical protein SGI92_26700 [Bryobacteraceae bacterium]|nr:hypothetical protein [Bryobacteraceae bacterium]